MPPASLMSPVAQRVGVPSAAGQNTPMSFSWVHEEEGVATEKVQFLSGPQRAALKIGRELGGLANNSSADRNAPKQERGYVCVSL